MLRVLLVEDVPQFRKRLTEFFDGVMSGYDVAVAGSLSEALACLAAGPPDLVLLDLGIPAAPDDANPHWQHGDELLDRVRAIDPSIAVVVLSAEDRLTRDFLKLRQVDDFFSKDLPAAWEGEQLPHQVCQLIGHLACRSPASRQLRGALADQAGLGTPVALQGPPGSGRRHAARLLHLGSPRRRQPIREVPLLSRGLEDTLATAASGQATGTAVLTGWEEAAHLDQALQHQLAEALQAAPPTAGPATLRFVLVRETHEPAGPELSPVLLRCLAEVPVVSVPPLTDRLEDLPELLDVFRRESALSTGKTVRTVSEEAVAWLMEWVGAGEFRGEAADLRQAVARAVTEAPGQCLELPTLQAALGSAGADQTSANAVICTNGRVVRRSVTRDEHAQLLGLEGVEFAFVATLDSHQQPTVARAHSGQGEYELDDERIGRVLYRLAARPGEKLPLGQEKTSLGLAPDEPVRRYIHKIRKLLGDTEVKGRASQLIESHYGEVYAFRTTVSYALLLPSENDS